MASVCASFPRVIYYSAALSRYAASFNFLSELYKISSISLELMPGEWSIARFFPIKLEVAFSKSSWVVRPTYGTLSFKQVPEGLKSAPNAGF